MIHPADWLVIVGLFAADSSLLFLIRWEFKIIRRQRGAEA